MPYRTPIPGVEKLLAATEIMGLQSIPHKYRAALVWGGFDTIDQIKEANDADLLAVENITIRGVGFIRNAIRPPARERR